MGSEFVQDPFWGNWATGLVKSIQSAPGTALNNAQTVEQILAAREKRDRDTKTWNASVNAANAYPDAVPKATVPPSFRDVVVENQGPVNPVDPTTRPGEVWLPPTTATESFIDPRLLAEAEARRRLAIPAGQAAILADPKQWAPQQAYGEVAARGMPTDPRRRMEMQFQTTGRWPTSDETKTPNAQNFVVVDANGQSTGQGFASLNGGRTAIDGTPIQIKPGERIMESGSVNLAKPNPIESVPIAQNNFNELAQRIQQKVANGEAISDAELNAARLMRDNGWQKEIKMETHKETGRLMPLVVYKIPPPTTGAVGWLFDTLDAIDGRPPRAAQVPQPPASPFPPPPPPATPADPNAPPPAPPAPIVPPAPAGRSLVEAQPAIGTGDPQPVVTSYRQQPVIVSIENAKNGYSSLIGNIENNDKSADLAMIVGAAKVLDPPSVVREGEVENVRKTGGIMDHFIGMVQSAKGESGLSKQVRAQLWQMVNDKLALDIKNAAAIREQHAVQLRQREVDPEKYLPPLPEIVPVNPSIISSKRINIAGERERVPATATTTAPAGTVTQEQKDQLRRELGR